MQCAKDLWFSFNNSCVSVSDHPSARASVFLSGSPISLLFIHGRLGQALVWKALLEELSADYRCVTVDLPGYGRSVSVEGDTFSLLEDTNLIIALIQQLTSSNEKVILVGHDIGGGIAQLVAFRIPEKVAGLVLINSACLTRRLSGLHQRKLNWTLCWRIKRLLKQARKLKAEDLELLWFPWKEKMQRDSLLKSYRALEDSWPWHYERQIWKEAVENLSLPTLLLWGGKDPLNPPEVGFGLVNRLPEAYFYVHNESSHWPNLEQPDWVNSKIREFLFKLEDKLDSGFEANLGQRSLLL